MNHTEEELYNMLLAKDKERAQTIDKHNKLRLVRALEIIEALGKVPKKGEATLRYNTVVYRTEISRELLKKRITRRLEKRIELGLIEEVEEIVHRGYNEQELKRFGIEYYVIAQFLSGALPYDAMKQEVIHASYLYAKRQETWNKKFFKDAIPVEIRQ
jgi:tRNA dimethylallyltransferase